jgi:hypothetical protein
MRQLILVLSVLTVAVIAAVSPAVAQTDGYRLPRDHQYERYDGATGTYSRVDVGQVPSLINQKIWIYDRTAQTWVYKAPDGLNAAYGAPASGGVVSGGLSLPPDHRYERYDGASGGYTKVDVGQVPGLVDKKIWVYDRTAQVWVYKAPQGVDPRYSGNVAGRAAGSARNGNDQFEQVTGVVQNVQGNQLTLRTDDNRNVTVDIAQARQGTSVKAGQRLSAIGYYTAPNRLTARAVRDVSGQADAQGKGDKWERIHGVVQSVQGSTVKFRADDGRMLTVDASKVGAPIRSALTQGEPVTVIGHDWTGPNQLRAEYIQQDSSKGVRQPAASPR